MSELVGGQKTGFICLWIHFFQSGVRSLMWIKKCWCNSEIRFCYGLVYSGLTLKRGSDMMVGAGVIAGVGFFIYNIFEMFIQLARARDL